MDDRTARQLGHSGRLIWFFVGVLVLFVGLFAWMLLDGHTSGHSEWLSFLCGWTAGGAATTIALTRMR